MSLWLKRIVLGSLVVFFGRPLPLPGQVSTRFGLVDSQRAFEASEQGRKAVAQLRDREQKIKAELSRLETEIQTLQTKYASQRFTLAYEALAQMESDLTKKMTDRKRYEEDAVKDFELLRTSLWTKIRNELVPIVQNLAKEKGLDAVFDTAAGGALYVSPAADLTDEVIKRFNLAKMPTK